MVSPSMDWFRTLVNMEPSTVLEPERVTALMPAPVKPPWRTSYGAMFTCTSWMASKEMGVELV